MFSDSICNLDVVISLTAADVGIVLTLVSGERGLFIALGFQNFKDLICWIYLVFFLICELGTFLTPVTVGPH